MAINILLFYWLKFKQRICINKQVKIFLDRSDCINSKLLFYIFIASVEVLGVLVF